MSRVCHIEESDFGVVATDIDIKEWQTNPRVELALKEIFSVAFEQNLDIGYIAIKVRKP